MEDNEGLPLPFVPPTVQLEDGTIYTLLKPLTNFKSCHDGTPPESRILFTCRRYIPQSTPDSSTSSDTTTTTTTQQDQEELIVKIKVQTPSPASPAPSPHQGPSDTTANEIRALTLFRTANSPYTPHLIAFTSSTQPPEQTQSKVPSGYMTYTIMTKMPGQTVFDLRYWDLTETERAEICRGFLIALRAIWGMGVEPVDRGLRNVLWERETKRCTIIDFELWNETTETLLDEKRELERWGLLRRPPPRDWWAEWSYHMR